MRHGNKTAKHGTATGKNVETLSSSKKSAASEMERKRLGKRERKDISSSRVNVLLPTIAISIPFSFS